MSPVPLVVYGAVLVVFARWLLPFMDRLMGWCGVPESPARWRWSQRLYVAQVAFCFLVAGIWWLVHRVG